MEAKDQDLFFMEIALELATEAALRKEVPVGAVVTLEDRIVGSGSNRVEERKDALAHAEILAIREAQASLGDWRLNQCTLYVTKEPCFLCTGAILLTRIGRVVYGVPDPRMGGLGGCINLLFRADGTPRSSCEVRAGVCQERCLELLQSFFRSLREESDRFP